MKPIAYRRYETVKRIHKRKYPLPSADCAAERRRFGTNRVQWLYLSMCSINVQWRLVGVGGKHAASRLCIRASSGNLGRLRAFPKFPDRELSPASAWHTFEQATFRGPSARSGRSSQWSLCDFYRHFYVNGI